MAASDTLRPRVADRWALLVKHDSMQANLRTAIAFAVAGLVMGVMIALAI